jgi:hypothetical protein
MTLRIVSPNLPGLSLVDMPGLTKIAIDGQPKSIVTELENMAREYVRHENVIILAVTPANADLATSDALRLAREVDPTGERTIGVLTKIDIMDPGTNCRDVLDGAAYTLRNGWIGIVNRGQADINSKVGRGERGAVGAGGVSVGSLGGLSGQASGGRPASTTSRGPPMGGSRRWFPGLSASGFRGCQPAAVVSRVASQLLWFPGLPASWEPR